MVKTRFFTTPSLPARFTGRGAAAPGEGGVGATAPRSRPQPAHGLPERQGGAKLRKKSLLPPEQQAARKAKVNKLENGLQLGQVQNPAYALDQIENPAHVRELAEALGVVEPGSPAAVGSAERRAMREILDDFQNELGNGMSAYDNDFVRRLDPPRAEGVPLVPGPLTAKECGELHRLMAQTHMVIKAEPADLPDRPPALKIFFHGSNKSLRDIGHNVASLAGMTGSNDRAARRLGELFAKVLSEPDQAELKFVGGLSMGGGMAQTFLATLQDHMAHPPKPPMVLLDPLLHNNRQARYATQHGDPYSQDVARGLVITLDYARAPRRGVVDKLKKYLGYRTGGLVHLAMGLDDTDGGGSPPRPTHPRLRVGYHDDYAYYAAALERFTASQREPARHVDATVLPRKTRVRGLAPVDIDLEDIDRDSLSAGEGPAGPDAPASTTAPDPTEPAATGTPLGFSSADPELFRDAFSLADTLWWPEGLPRAERAPRGEAPRGASTTTPPDGESGPSASG